MAGIVSSDHAPGLRERKKQQTRDTIARVAFELFLEHGYDETTIDDIATAAEISRRTVFSYYPTKEDILFHEEPRILVEVERRLLMRPPGVSIADALGDLLTTFVPDQNAALRKRVIGTNESLRRSERARFERLEEILVPAIAQDLGVETEDLRPRLLAASATAAFHVTLDHMITVASRGGECQDSGVAAFGYLLDLLRSGIEALTQ